MRHFDDSLDGCIDPDAALIDASVAFVRRLHMAIPGVLVPIDVAQEIVKLRSISPDGEQMVGALGADDGIGRGSAGAQGIHDDGSSPRIGILDRSRHRRGFAVLFPADPGGDGNGDLMTHQRHRLEGKCSVYG